MRDDACSDHLHLDTAPQLARVRRIQNDRPYRDWSGLFFIEGVRNFVQAVDHRFQFDTLLYSERLLISPLARKLARRLKRSGVPFARLTPEEFCSISCAERPSGIAAILRQRVRRLEHVQPASHDCWTALSDVRSPGNLGTLIRTSAATGGAGFILLGEAIDPFGPAVVRATMGAIFRQKIVRTTVDRLRHWVRIHKVQVVGASPDGADDYDRVCYRRPLVLVLGNERCGLTEEQRRICRNVVRIPMVDGMDSLNVAIAGSLLMYQVYRSWSR
jgi:TrmH family RNA methyltransferase